MNERRTRLRVEAAPGRPRVRVTTTGATDQSPGLRPMVLGSDAELVRVCLVPDGALLLAGDEIRLEVEVVGPVNLEITEPAGTVAYDMHGAEARWQVDVRVDDGARLVWAGEPFVVAQGARVTRETTLRLGESAAVAMREVLVLGRHQEAAGRLLQSLTVTDADDAPLLVESQHLGPSAQVPGVLGPHRVLGTILAFDLDLPDDLEPEGRFDLEHGGVLWRRLADQAHLAVPGDAWAAVRSAKPTTAR